MADDLTVTPEALHVAYREVFTTAAGRVVLADLVRHFGFTRRSTIAPGDPYLTAANEGQRTVVVYIEKRLTEDPATQRVEEPDFDGGEPVPYSTQPEADDDLGFSD